MMTRQDAYLFMVCIACLTAFAGILGTALFSVQQAIIWVAVIQAGAAIGFRPWEK
jgi:cyanate permease